MDLVFSMVYDFLSVFYFRRSGLRRTGKVVDENRQNQLDLYDLEIWNLHWLLNGSICPWTPVSRYTQYAIECQPFLFSVFQQNGTHSVLSGPQLFSLHEDISINPKAVTKTPQKPFKNQQNCVCWAQISGYYGRSRQTNYKQTRFVFHVACFAYISHCDHLPNTNTGRY